jgi:hypothetical protein
MECATTAALAFQAEPKLFVHIKTEPQVAEYVFALAEYCNWSSRANARMKHLYSGLRKLSIGIKAAAMIGQRLRVDSSFRKAIHFPWFAEKTTGPAVFRTFTLVICHGLRSRACCFLGGGDCWPSWRSFCGRNRRQHLFSLPRVPSFLALYAMNCRASPL